MPGYECDQRFERVLLHAEIALEDLVPGRGGRLYAVAPACPADEKRKDHVLEDGDDDYDRGGCHASSPPVCQSRRFHYHPRIINGCGRNNKAGITMIGFLLRAAIAALGLWVASRFLPGMSFDSTQKLVFAALVLGIVNAIVRPIAFVLTLPFTILTLGLFLFVLNGAMIALVARLVPGFRIDGLWTAVLAAIIVGVISWAGSSLIGNKGRLEPFKSRD